MQTVVTTVQKVQEVSALLEIPDSRIIAGGTGLLAPRESFRLIDISALEGLNGIKQKGNRIEIGPLATLSALSASHLLKMNVPVLTEAAEAVNDETVREKGTLGGNIADERIGDAAVALLACGAKLTIKTGADFRELLIDRFWTPDGQNDLQYDEWITKITLQMPKEQYMGEAFGKIGQWGRDTEPLAAAAVRMSLNEDNEIAAVRGGLRIGKKNIRRMFPLEKALKNQKPGDSSFAKAAAVMAAAVRSEVSEAALSDLLAGLLQRGFTMANERRVF